MKKKKAIVSLFIVLWFLDFSSLPSTISVPSSRSLKASSHISNQELYGYDHFHEIMKMKYWKMGSRMDMETADYSGAGANNHHDPRPPGSY